MANKFAVVFPGQGSQSLGMLNEFKTEHGDLVSSVCQQASEVLGYDMDELITRDPEQKLNQTAYTQPAILTTSYIAWQVWQKTNDQQPAYLAGHSLGEYTALVCAQALSFSQALKLVAKRGELMQAAVAPGAGAMAAVLGLSLEEVARICASPSDTGCQPANLNAPGQIVIAGTKQAVELAIEKAKAAGAKKAIMLPVSVPSHCDLMRPAAEKFANYLRDVQWQQPQIPVIHNYDVAAHQDAASICQVLDKQLYSPVRWIETVEFFMQQGITDIIECAPGKVLTGLIKRIYAK